MFKIFTRKSSSLKIGGKYTPQFKLYKSNETNSNNLQSFFHDIPLNFNKEKGTVDMIVEIPRYEQGKFEISNELPLNPIVQDTKKDKLRFINNIYPFNGYPCNYGALPQTWEDPTFALEIKNEKYFGDNDPLDICEIGSQSSNITKIGTLKTVKILGCLAMIDDGELDWKLLSIDITDKLANQLDDIDDVNKHMPLLLENLTRWFKNYKLPMNKPENEFGYDGKWLNKEKALSVVQECHEKWKILVSGQHTGDKLPSISNSTIKDTPGYCTVDNLDINIKQKTEEDGSIPTDAHEIFYYAK
jgi:inorganic pyrophosphatase